MRRKLLAIFLSCVIIFGTFSGVMFTGTSAETAKGSDIMNASAWKRLYNNNGATADADAKTFAEFEHATYTKVTDTALLKINDKVSLENALHFTRAGAAYAVTKLVSLEANKFYKLSFWYRAPEHTNLAYAGALTNVAIYKNVNDSTTQGTIFSDVAAADRGNSGWQKAARATTNKILNVLTGTGTWSGATSVNLQIGKGILQGATKDTWYKFEGFFQSGSTTEAMLSFLQTGTEFYLADVKLEETAAINKITFEEDYAKFVDDTSKSQGFSVVSTTGMTGNTTKALQVVNNGAATQILNQTTNVNAQTDHIFSFPVTSGKTYKVTFKYNFKTKTALSYLAACIRQGSKNTNLITQNGGFKSAVADTWYEFSTTFTASASSVAFFLNGSNANNNFTFLIDDIVIEDVTALDTIGTQDKEGWKSYSILSSTDYSKKVADLTASATTVLTETTPTDKYGVQPTYSVKLPATSPNTPFLKEINLSANKLYKVSFKYYSNKAATISEALNNIYNIALYSANAQSTLEGMGISGTSATAVFKTTANKFLNYTPSGDNYTVGASILVDNLSGANTWSSFSGVFASGENTAAILSLASSDATTTLYFADFAIEEIDVLNAVGASARVTEGKEPGTRFKSNINIKALETATREDGRTGLLLQEYGTVVVRTSYLGSEALKLDTKYNGVASKAGIAFNSLDGTEITYETHTENGEYNRDYTGVLINLGATRWNEDYSARAYYKVRDTKTDVVYTVYDGVTQEASYFGVISAALNNPDDNALVSNYLDNNQTVKEAYLMAGYEYQQQ